MFRYGYLALAACAMAVVVPAGLTAGQKTGCAESCATEPAPSTCSTCSTCAESQWLANGEQIVTNPVGCSSCESKSNCCGKFSLFGKRRCTTKRSSICSWLFGKKSQGCQSCGVESCSAEPASQCAADPGCPCAAANTPTCAAPIQATCAAPVQVECAAPAKVECSTPRAAVSGCSDCARMECASKGCATRSRKTLFNLFHCDKRERCSTGCAATPTCAAPAAAECATPACATCSVEDKGCATCVPNCAAPVGCTDAGCTVGETAGCGCDNGCDDCEVETTGCRSCLWGSCKPLCFSKGCRKDNPALMEGCCDQPMCIGRCRTTEELCSHFDVVKKTICIPRVKLPRCKEVVKSMLGLRGTVGCESCSSCESNSCGEAEGCAARCGVAECASCAAAGCTAGGCGLSGCAAIGCTTGCTSTSAACCDSCDSCLRPRFNLLSCFAKGKTRVVNGLRKGTHKVCRTHHEWTPVRCATEGCAAQATPGCTDCAASPNIAVGEGDKVEHKLEDIPAPKEAE